MTSVKPVEAKPRLARVPAPPTIPAPAVLTPVQTKPSSPVYRADVALFLFWMFCMFFMAGLIAFETIAGLLGKR
jgi:hypothetical protein